VLALLDDSLCEIEASTKTVRKLAKLDASWCQFDPGNSVVWAMVPKEVGSALVVVELNGQIHEVLTFDKAHASGEVRLRIDESRSLGRIFWMDTEPQVEVDLQRGTTRGISTCHGDALWYCTEEPRSPDQPWPFREDFRVQLEALGEGRVTDEELLHRLALRADEVPQVTKKPQERFTIPTEICKVQDMCGAVTALLPTPYWLVTTNWDYGDFAHTYYQLFDPRTREFFVPDKPGVRSKETPVADSRWQLDYLHFSPSGDFFLEYGAIRSLKTGESTKIDRPCGWLGGGVEYKEDVAGDD
jgi:hypothetical protein